MSNEESPPHARGLSSFSTPRTFKVQRAYVAAALTVAAALLTACTATSQRPKPFLSVESIPPENPVVIVIGDTQQTLSAEFRRENNEDKTPLLLREIARRRPAFVLHLGDITAWGASDSYWAWFDDASLPIRQAGIPCFPILGNHDYFGSDTTALANARERFPELQKSLWYSFTHRGAAFILLNSNFGSLTEREKESQQRWYLNELSRFDDDPSIRWIVVACHHPPFTNSKVVSPSEEARIEFADPFEQSSKGNLFFSGHCHSYERFEEGGKTFLVSGGGGGPRQPLETEPKKRLFRDQFNGPSLRFVHFCELTLGPDQVEVEVVRLKDESLGFSFTVVDRLRIPPPPQ